MRRLALVAVMLTLLAACDDVRYVPRLVLVNPTDYDILVHVRGAGDTPWLPLGIAHGNAETVNEHVIDMGDSWFFRFLYEGAGAGEGSVSRSELVRNRWRYRIPDEIGEGLRAKGVPPAVGGRREIGDG